MQTNNLLPQQAIDEFKIIYLKKFGKKITDEQARVQAMQLYQLYDAVYRKRVKQKS